jgi:putative hydrolase of the HAD superfamily
MTGRTDATRPIGFWLVPARASHARFDSIIRDLAREFDAPPFEPHVTVYAGAQGAQDDIEAALAGVAASMGPITLVARDTGHADALFKTLFVQFEPDKRPHSLCRALREGLAHAVDYGLHPHLSLIYKVLPEAVRRQLAARYDFRGQAIVFDEIAAVRPALDDRDWMDISGWHVWLRAPLGGR